MSKILYVVNKNAEFRDSEIDIISEIFERLSPDNISSRPPKINLVDRIVYGFSNPSDIIKINESNVFFGQSFGLTEGWEKVNGIIPDGNYAIFRTNKEKVEILSDVLGTKAIWYYHDENIFIASTSQRALIMYLGKFEFNENVIPWIVSNGILGPGQSWDKNISLLPPESKLVLDRFTWNLTTKIQEVEFKPNNKSNEENFKLFKTTLNSVLSQLSLDYSKWNLTLSGGYDSRGILFALPKKDHELNTIETITWGLESSLKSKGNDAFIAKKLAKNLKIPHKYYCTDTSSDETISVIIDRFLNNGEGRIDHIGGYMDGFSIWKNLFENGVKGIIRGDEVFGSYDFVSEFHMIKFMGLSLPKDYNNLNKIEWFKKNPAVFPEKFNKKSRETNEMWRDRLYHSNLVPNFLSALEDLKQPYIEQINPLLSRNIVNLIRELPDHLRTEKKIFKLFVNSFNNPTNFANSSAIKPMGDIFRQRELVKVVKKEIDSSLAKSILSEELISYVLENLKITPDSNFNNKNLWRKFKMLIPKGIKKRLLKETFNRNVDINVVGFRLFMILKMYKILKEDSQVLNKYS